jgi:hypothetical protein
MAEAKKCDRCKKFYEIGPLTSRGTFLIRRKDALITTPLDLCPECNDSLSTWFTNANKE